MLRTLGLQLQKQWDSKSRFHDPLRHPQRLLALPVFKTTIRAALRTPVIGLHILLPEVQCGRDVGVAGAGRWPVCLPLLPEALMAWNIAHLAKGSLSVPPPTGWRLLPVFPAQGKQAGRVGGQGGTLSQLRAGKCSLILVRGEGGREKHFFLGWTHSRYHCSYTGETVQEASAAYDSVTTNTESKVTFTLNLFWATD